LCVLRVQDYIVIGLLVAIGGTSAGEDQRAAEAGYVVDPSATESRRTAAQQGTLGLRAGGDAVAGQRLRTGTQVEEGRGTQGVNVFHSFPAVLMSHTETNACTAFI